MDWSQLLIPCRFNGTTLLDHTPESGRSEFHKDYDRLIFSQSLRRLARKTQVHPLTINDHVHTRLTHSLEVACVGRSLGQQLGKVLQQREQLPTALQPEDIGTIVQSACLAHDIGNPPFGHTGEDCIRDWFNHQLEQPLMAVLQTSAQAADLCWFDGNAQGFRTVVQLEKHWFAGGLRLSAPTLGALLKYPWSASQSAVPGKFSCFQAELHLLEQLANLLGMPARPEGGWARHPLAFLVEAADDICYLILDLEDAVELAIITSDNLFALMKPLLSTEQVKTIVQRPQFNKTRLALLRGFAMDRILQALLVTYLDHYDDILAGHWTQTLTTAVGDLVVRDFLEQARSLAENVIFRNSVKTSVEIGAYATLETLLNAFIGAGFALHQNGFEKLSKRHQALINMMGNYQPSEQLSAYSIYLRVLDYLSGMTDQYALRLANQLRGVY